MRNRLLAALGSIVIAGSLLTLATDDAFAFRGGYRGGAVAARGGVARGAYRAGAYRGYRAGAYRGAYGRYGLGAAAVGAAAVGAGAYYRRGCGYDAFGRWVCPSFNYPHLRAGLPNLNRA